LKRDLGGTVRGREAAETLACLTRVLPAVGITRVADVTGLDRIGIPVAICVRPAARSLSVSQGKGVSRELARVSAVMESLELYHAEHACPPQVVASYSDIRQCATALDPKALKSGIRWRAYHPQKAIGWVRATDLSCGEPVFVPHARLYMESAPLHGDADILSADSNGLASGNDLWEAICHGLYETIERDCDWRWHRLPPSERRRRLLDNETIDSPLLCSLLERFARAEVVPSIWDITSTLGVPAYRCVISGERGWRAVGPCYGAGCHLSAEVALARALTEAAQSRLTYIVGSRDDLFPSVYERRAHGTFEASEPLPIGTRSFHQRDDPPLMATFEEDARYVVQRLVDAGYAQVIVVNHTRPDLGIPVAHIIVPGLQFCPR
jgi:ribosomal protein S12 methylthiotransferase accessory factor